MSVLKISGSQPARVWAWLAALLLFNVLSTDNVMGTSAKEEKQLFDFESPGQVQNWRVINDGVMGGISSSRVESGGPSVMRFVGTVSLENYGGFCSTSLQPGDPHDLSGFSGIRLRVRGDGQRYKLTLKNDNSFTGFVYQYDFDTPQNAWAEIVAPFADFKAVFRGAVQPNADRLDPGRIMSFGFIISDKQAGPFQLEIDWIKAYGLKNDSSAQTEQKGRQ